MTHPRAVGFHVRAAAPADVPALMRLKRLLALGEDSLHAVQASEADWLRDGFGPDAGFCAFVAEAESAASGNAVIGNSVIARSVIGMATCSRRTLTGWNGPVLFLQDLIVETAWRRHGVAAALVARVAALAREIGSPIVELTVRADNKGAQRFYEENGFMPVPQCLTYVLAGPALLTLADRDQAEAEKLALAV